jgi:AcrR family transcriptional regulator
MLIPSERSFCNVDLLPEDRVPRVTQEHKDRVRQEILDAALECFAARGYAATSVDDIAAASGKSIGALYHYFDSKKEMFLALMARDRAFDIRSMPSYLRDVRSFEGALAAIMRWLAETTTPGRAKYARVAFEFWMHAAREADLRLLGEQENHRYEAMVAKELTFAAESDRERLAKILVALTDGLLLHMSYYDLEPVGVAGVAEQLARSPLRGTRVSARS